MNRFGVVTIVLLAMLSIGCSGSKPDSANTAISDTCDLQSAHRNYLDGQKAANPGDYATAIKMFTLAAERFETCAQTQHEPESLQTTYDEAMALFYESDALKKSRDSRYADVAQNAETLFEQVTTSSSPNRPCDKPIKSPLRCDALVWSEIIKMQLQAEKIGREIGAASKEQSTFGQLFSFDNEANAQAHCPNDTVVWLNLKSGVYHMKGERWYGATVAGTYVCQQEADAAGDRATKNGQ